MSLSMVNVNQTERKISLKDGIEKVIYRLEVPTVVFNS